MAHEIAGHIGAEKIFSGFKDMMKQLLKLENSDKNIKAIFDDVRSRYTNLSETDIAAEVFAKIMEQVYNNEQSFTGKIKNLINFFIKKVKDFFRSLFGMDIPMSAREVYAIANNIMKVTTVKSIMKGEVARTNIYDESKAFEDEPVFDNTQNTRAYYQIPFSESVDNIVNGTYKGNDSVYVTNTPKILHDLGFINLPLLMTKQHILSVYNPSNNTNIKGNKHDLGQSIKQLPKLIHNPLMVITSKTNPNTSVVLITAMKDNNGNDVIVPIKVDGSGRADGLIVDAHFVASAYGKKNTYTKLVSDAINNEKKRQYKHFLCF